MLCIFYYIFFLTLKFETHLFRRVLKKGLWSCSNKPSTLSQVRREVKTWEEWWAVKEANGFEVLIELKHWWSNLENTRWSSEIWEIQIFFWKRHNLNNDHGNREKGTIIRAKGSKQWKWEVRIQGYWNLHYGKKRRNITVGEKSHELFLSSSTILPRRMWQKKEER